MNLKHSTRSMGIVLMAVALMSVTSVHQDVFAQGTGMSLTATAGGTSVSVSGATGSNMDVTLVVTAPNGNIVSIDQLTPDTDGMFGTDIMIGGQLWSQDGMYTITAQQGSASLYTIELVIEVNGGIATDATTTESSILEEAVADVIESVASSEDVGLSITATAVEGSDTIGITGTTSKTNEDVTFTVNSPNGNLVSVSQLTPEASGDFALDITTGGPLWSQDGVYTVVAQQGNASGFTDSVEVEIADGLVVPEFGTIAAMILAVAIISIIAISAKSRLSIMPRY